MAKQRLQDRPRYASGRAKPKNKRDAEAERMQTVLKQRMRYLAAPGEPATDRRYGSFLGKLCLQGILSLTQWDAAERYEEVRLDFLGLKTEQKPTASCQLAAMVFGSGLSTAPELPDHIAISKDEYHQGMMEKLKDMEKAEGPTTRHFKLIDFLDRVTVYDLEVALTPDNVACLRSSFNVLAKYFQFVR